MAFKAKSIVIERSGLRTIINDNGAYIEVILDGEGIAARADYVERTLTIFFIKDGGMTPAITIPITDEEVEALRTALSSSDMDMDAASALDFITTLARLALVKLKSNTPGITLDEKSLGKALDFINRATFFYGS
jgi:hypothetical protein